MGGYQERIDHDDPDSMRADQQIAETIFRPNLVEKINLHNQIAEMVSSDNREGLVTKVPELRTDAKQFIYDALEMMVRFGNRFEAADIAVNGSQHLIFLPKVPSQKLVEHRIITDSEVKASIAKRDEVRLGRKGRPAENYLIVKALSTSELNYLPLLQGTPDYQSPEKTSIFPRLSALDYTGNRPGISAVKHPLVPLTVFKEIQLTRDIDFPVILAEEVYTKTLPPEGVIDIDTRARYLVYKTEDKQCQILFLDEEQEVPHAHDVGAVTGEPIKKYLMEFQDPFKVAYQSLIDTNKIPVPVEPRPDRQANNEHLAKMMVLIGEAIDPPLYPPAFAPINDIFVRADARLLSMEKRLG